MEKHTTVAIDIAKNVFELAESQTPGQVSRRRRVPRGALLRLFLNREPVTVVMEACGSAHHWARQIESLGHGVALLPPHHVRRYRIGNKTDRTDTNALLEARRNEKILPVPVKSISQQVLGFLHRSRTAWIQARTARLNALRGVLREMGVCIPVGATHVLPAVTHALQQELVVAGLQPLLTAITQEVRELDGRILESEKQLETIGEQTLGVSRIRTVPGIGLLGSTALAVAIVDPSRFRSGRQMASFLGLVPRESSSGDRRHLGSITKRGDPYVRTLMIHGARSILLAAKRSKRPDRLRTWALDVERRQGHNRAAVALANKMVRIAWAVWSKDTNYVPDYGVVADNARSSTPSRTTPPKARFASDATSPGAVEAVEIART